MTPKLPGELTNMLNAADGSGPTPPSIEDGHRLITAFLKISNEADRFTVIDLAEKLAGDSAAAKEKLSR